MHTQNLRRRVICGLTAGAICLGAYQAAEASGYKRIIETFWSCIYLPSVDHYGCLNWYCTSKAKCKVIINHKKGTCYAICCGKVKNESYCSHTYCNEGVIGSDACENCCWYKDIYTVAKNGRCRALAWGNYNEYGCDCDDDGYESGSQL